MALVFVTRVIPQEGIARLEEAGHEVVVSDKEGVLNKEELCAALAARPYEAVITLLTDVVDAAVFDAVPALQICANYAVGFNNIDRVEAARRGVIVTHTPDVLTSTVAEHTAALILALSTRTVEGDRFVRAGQFTGWSPMLLLGSDLKGKTLGVIGAGRIGGQVARMMANGFGMRIAYYDIERDANLESQCNAVFYSTVEEVLQEAFVVTLHVPLLPSTRHLLNKERLALLSKESYVVNTSRGAVIEEEALVAALEKKELAGAALDVFEYEPDLTPGLAELENVVLTPHIASATKETRGDMARMAADDIIRVLEGDAPHHPVPAR